MVFPQIASHPLLRLQVSIDTSVQILEKQFEIVAETLAETEGLKNGKLDETLAKPLPVYKLFLLGSPHVLPCV